MIEKKQLSILSLAQKAGRIASGEYAAEQAVKNGGAYLLILTEDASENTKKKFQNSAFYYEVPVLVCLTKDELGDLLGKEQRAVAAVLDEGFARTIQKKLQQNRHFELNRNISDDAGGKNRSSDRNCEQE